MNCFRGLIKCKLCGKNLNRKSDRGIVYWVCSTAKNYGKSKCPDSSIIKEEDLLYLIENHCKINNKNFTVENIGDMISKIEIGKDEEIEVYYNDGSKSIWNSNELIF